MRTLNLGILAHVDAGKTSLTERLLHAAGVIDEIGRVDDGTTQTDTLALERQRGITIRAAVVSFLVDDVTVNLIDTPGHPDFIAEVERVLHVLDGAVLVISAIEGVQAQTRILMRALQRTRVPTLIFVNKVDRPGADADRVLDAVAERLTQAIVTMGSTCEIGTPGAEFVPFVGTDADVTSRVAEVLAEGDETFMAAYVEGAAISDDTLGDELAKQAHRALVHPVFFGSAQSGAGVGELMAALTTLLPAVEGDSDAPLSGSIFKVERGPASERIAYVRLFAGILHAREVEVRSIPPAFLTAVEDTTRHTLRQGLSGWAVSDGLVTVTVCDHRPPPVPVGGFRDLTPLVAMAALVRAGTTVREPIHRFRLELPGDSVGAALAALARLEAAPSAHEAQGSSWVLTGTIRAARLRELHQQVPGLTGGEGVVEDAFDSYQPVTGEVPTRPRSDRNPLNRDEYLLHVAGRV